jgi:hypothetical protein
VLRRALPVALVLAAAAADGGGQHLLAFYLLVVAVPAAAAAALTVLGELVQLPAGAGVAAARVQALLGALGLTAVVVAAAARANAVDSTSVPTLGVSAVVACLSAFALQGLVALLAGPRETDLSVRWGHVRGQTPAMSAAGAAGRDSSAATEGNLRPGVAMSRGLTPDMSRIATPARRGAARRRPSPGR